MVEDERAMEDGIKKMETLIREKRVTERSADCCKGIRGKECK